MDWESRSDALKAEFITHAHAALEAAAPYMQAPGIRRPMEKGALFEELRRLNPSGALLKDIEALEQQD
ncbi:hypothetical protein ACFC25_04130 [Pseudarthrobacter sp. NPDC055928]|uniref:hypothetical protein n=1 Tax=Pseudarthrobacter sp. NPDC055928 TaxID=3345661 RepID=UPI0035DA474E